MRLDPNKSLSSATIQAMVDLFPAPPEHEIDEVTILQVAMGMADAKTRRVCALAILANPEVATRLARARRQVTASMSSLNLDARQVDDLRCLAEFVGPFSLRDAAVVFPDRFKTPESLLPFEARGWLEEVRDGESGNFLLSNEARKLAASPIGEEISRGWRDRFVSHYAAVGLSIDRTLSELRWLDASEPLNRNLANLRKAWGLASERGSFEVVERFTRNLLVALLEFGANEEFSDLLMTGYLAADGLGKPRLRSWLLSFEGVAAARLGDPDRAREIWWHRVALNRTIPNPVGEADALLDIAASHHTAGDDKAFRALVDDLDRVVAAAERADLEARFLALLAVDRLRANDPATSVLHARKALSLLSGVDGVDQDLSVRFSAAKTLSGCGLTWDAYDSLTDMLSVCVESGRSVAAAFLLAELASHFEAQGDSAMALRCLDISLTIHRQVGTRYSDTVAARVLALRREVPSDPSWLINEAVGTGPWESGCLVILAEIARVRALAFPS
jgi:hypothetical protein